MYLLWLGIICYFLAFILSLLYHFISTFKKPTLFSLFLGWLFYMVYVIKMALDIGSFPFADIYGFYSLLGNGMVLLLLLISFKQEQLQKFFSLFFFDGYFIYLFSSPCRTFSLQKSTLFSAYNLCPFFSYAFALFGGFFSLIKFMVEAKLKQKSLSGFFYAS